MKDESVLNDGLFSIHPSSSSFILYKAMRTPIEGEFWWRRRPGDPASGDDHRGEGGYTVVPARDGREAYKLLQSNPDILACISR